MASPGLRGKIPVERKQHFMRNLKSLAVVTSLTAAAAVTLITGCKTSSQSSSDRSEGRIVDDKEIASSVEKRLKSEPVYKFNDVEVKTFDGIVQLSGFVNMEDQRRRAAEIATQVPGVVEVQNNISLKPTYAPTGRITTPTQNPNPPNNPSPSSNPNPNPNP